MPEQRPKITKRKISRKLFFSFLAISLATVALMSLVILVSTYRVFGDFAAERKLEEFRSVVSALSRDYEVHGEFRFSDPRAWHRYVVENTRPKHRSPMGRGVHPPPPHPPPINSARIPVLLTSGGKPVAGPYDPSADYQKLPIVVRDDTVGWLALEVLRQSALGLNAVYLKRQTSAVYFAGLLALIVSILSSFMFSRWISRPVRNLIKGTEALSRGDRDVRVHSSSNDELGRLAVSFNNMAAAIAQNEKTRAAWLSDIAHELRTPLAILQGSTEALQDGIRPLNMGAVDTIHGEVMRLKRLVDDIHHLSMADNDAIQYRFSILNPLNPLSELLRRYERSYQNAGLTLDGPASINGEIQGDAGRLEQLYTNLLENSLKYTTSPGGLKISAEMENESIAVYFEDTPPAVPNEDIEMIFERLFRVDKARSRASGGSGLGLSICRTIVEAHQGEINAGASAAGGLKITIRFPVWRAE